MLRYKYIECLVFRNARDYATFRETGSETHFGSWTDFLEWENKLGTLVAKTVYVVKITACNYIIIYCVMLYFIILYCFVL